MTKCKEMARTNYRIGSTPLILFCHIVFCRSLCCHLSVFRMQQNGLKPLCFYEMKTFFFFFSLSILNRFSSVRWTKMYGIFRHLKFNKCNKFSFKQVFIGYDLPSGFAIKWASLNNCEHEEVYMMNERRNIRIHVFGCQERSGSSPSEFKRLHVWIGTRCAFQHRILRNN